MLLYRTWHLQRGKMLDGDEGVGWNCLSHSVHLPAGRLRAEKDGMYEQQLLHEKPRETINEIRIARRLVLARLTVESTMSHGESQIGYLANYMIMYGGYAHRRALRGHRRVATCMPCVACARHVDCRKWKPTKFCCRTHRGFNAGRVIDNAPGINEECSGWVNSITQPVRVADMKRSWKLGRHWERW